MQRFYFILSLLISFSIGQIWADVNETVDFSAGNGTHNSTTKTNTWTFENYTIVQSKGSSTAYEPSESYLTTPRWYKGNEITVTPATNVTITKIVLTASAASNNGRPFAFNIGSGTEVLYTNSTIWTGTATNTSPLVITPGEQFRMSEMTVTYQIEEVTPPTPVENWTEGVRDGLTAGSYYTMCLDKAVTDVRGASIWRVSSKAPNGTDIILEEETGSLDAGRPYIFYATATSMDVIFTGDAVLTPVTEGNNGLVGSFTQQSIAQSPNNYILYNNALYYVNSDNVYVGANRAYLVMSDVPAYSEESGNTPRRRVMMSVHAQEVATGVDAINTSDKPMKLMIDGQLFILHAEKMYDATGRLVK